MQKCKFCGGEVWERQCVICGAMNTNDISTIPEIEPQSSEPLNEPKINYYPKNY